MTERLRWLIGYVRIRVPARGARFFAIANAEGLGLFSISWRGGGLEAGVLLPEIGHLRRVVRRARVRVEILGGGGLPFFLLPARRHPPIPILAAVFLAAWFVLGQMVISVSFDAPAGKFTTAAREVAARAHLSPWTPKATLDLAALTKDLKAIPGVVFAGVTFDGTRALVTVRPGPEPTQPPGNLPRALVAGRDGVVRRVVVFKGVARIRRGEAVRQGEILIAGAAGPPPEELAPGTKLGDIVAEGEVDALVEIAQTVRLALVRTEKVRAGPPAWRMEAAGLGRRETLLAGPEGQVRVVRQIRIGSLAGTGIVATLEEPLRTVRVTTPIASLVTQARQKAEADLRRLAPDARWLGWRQGYKIQKTELVLTLTGTAEENIARPAGGRSSGTSD